MPCLCKLLIYINACNLVLVIKAPAIRLAMSMDRERLFYFPFSFFPYGGIQIGINYTHYHNSF